LIILALDTTTRAGSVAVADEDRVLALVRGDESRTHGERIPGEIARALEIAALTKQRLDLLAVATGPGAFTGLRIGLAAIQGLAMTLNKPVAGVSALDALAAQVTASETDLVVPWMDAQRGDVFATVIDKQAGRTLAAPVASNPGALLEVWRDHLDGKRAIFIGDAVTRDAALITGLGNGGWALRTPSELAPQIAQLGRQLALRGAAGAPHTLEPIYVRRPDAEIERDRLGGQNENQEGGRRQP
jgi:tRNA threonylcarbamoyladenosine biosynthesis protein TsaB